MSELPSLQEEILTMLRRGLDTVRAATTIDAHMLPPSAAGDVQQSHEQHHPSHSSHPHDQPEHQHHQHQHQPAAIAVEVAITEGEPGYEEAVLRARHAQEMEREQRLEQLHLQQLYHQQQLLLQQQPPQPQYQQPQHQYEHHQQQQHHHQLQQGAQHEFASADSQSHAQSQSQSSHALSAQSAALHSIGSSDGFEPSSEATSQRD
jgi:hypothetical protein